MRHVDSDSEYESEEEETEVPAADEPEVAEEMADTCTGAARNVKTMRVKRLRERVYASAPYLAVTTDGLLVNLQHRRKGSDGEIAKELDTYDAEDRYTS